jgi:phosphoglucomutase
MRRVITSLALTVRDRLIERWVHSSGLIDRVVAGLRRRLVKVPVGFKRFVDGLLDSSLAFAGAVERISLV